jgi:hypothetical protein
MSLLTPEDLVVLDAMEQAIENSLSKEDLIVEAHVTPLGQRLAILSEARGDRGFAYERRVLAALGDAQVSGDIQQPGGASKSGPDVDIIIGGKVHPVEVKADELAQMGGSSVRYYRGSSSVELVSLNIEPTVAEVLTETVLDHHHELDEMLAALASEEPEEINQRATRFPCTVTLDAWNKASRANKLVNAYLTRTAKFIAGHYRKKNVNYIQIGGAGLFYLEDNPAGLPIPKLVGEVLVEIRSARSGSRRLSSGVRVVGTGIRVQGRLKTKNSSPYTLDNPDSIRALIADTGQ